MDFDKLYETGIKIDIETFPYPNEHSARVRDPGDFQEGSFRRIKITEGVDAIIGRLKGETSTTAQSYRFDKTKFTPAEARAWCKENDIKYILFEPASESNQSNFQDENIYWKRDVELWKAGNTIDGRSVSKSRVEKVFQNTLKLLKSVMNFKIPVKPDGHWHTGEKIIGTVENIRKIKNTIIGDLKFKIKEVWEDITNGSYIAPSAEIKIFDGYGEVLSAVALIGNSIPAFPDLQGLHKAEIENIFCMNDMEWVSHEDFFDIAQNKKEEITDMEMKELLEKFNSRFDKIEEALSKKDMTDEERAELQKQNDELKAEYQTVKDKIESYEKEKEVKLNSELEKFVNNLIESKKVKPSEKERLVSHFKALCKDNIFNEDNFKEDMLFKMIQEIDPENVNEDETLSMTGTADNVGDFGSTLGNEKESYDLYEKSKGLTF